MMRKSQNTHYQFFVEGQCEERLVRELKANGLIVSGKVTKKNVIQELIPDPLLRTMSENSIAILVFDTDTNNISVLEENIKRLKAFGRAQTIWLVMQVRNLEDELVRSTSVRRITDLLNSKSISEFKHDFIKEQNLFVKLTDKNFDIGKIWVTSPNGLFSRYSNNGANIKL